MPETLHPFPRRPRERPDAPPFIARPDDLDRLLRDDALAEWITDELVKPGAVLEVGASERSSTATPPIARSTVTSMVRHTLRDARQLVERFLPSELRAEAALHGAGSDAHARLEQGARLLTRLIASYWEAVRAVYPTAWNDRDGHLLLSTEGLTALSRFGAEVIAARVEKYEILPASFVAAMQPVAERVSLARANRPALAPHPAADQLLAELSSALRGAAAIAAAALFPVSPAWNSSVSPVSAPSHTAASPTSAP